MENNFVALGKCRFCGHESGEILINQKLKDIKPEEMYSNNPCPECKKRFKDHKYFIGNCGHNGFIKIKALDKVFSPEGLKKIGTSKIFRVEKCLMCMGVVKKEDIKEI